MKLTARQLNRATLDRQMLLRRERLDVEEAVRRVVALQAQEPPSPYLALWNRVTGFDAADLDRAFATQQVVKATLMRVTLHAVAASDYAPFHEAMQSTLRSARLDDRRFRSEQVSIETVEALVPDLLEFVGEPRRKGDVEAWLHERFGEPKPRVWWALRQYGPIVHATTGGAWAFGPRPAYVGALDRERSGDAAASVRHLVRRYLGGFGPATAADIAQFSTILRAPIRAALDTLGEELDRHEGPGGAVLYDLPEARLPPEDSPAPPRLLPMWDSVLLAYADRSRVIPTPYRKLVIRTNGDVLPTLLVDGSVAGVWRPVDGAIELTAFAKLPRATSRGLEEEASALAAFLDERDPRIYARYAHWWPGLPAAEVRVIGR
ncbi:MAG TPA: winged helix DNA-binding domain-containing protein [Candidatus Limnocylindrales bacterium]